MKITTDLFGVFYRNRGKWIGPVYGELFSEKYIIDQYGSTYNFIESVRKQYRKPVILMQQVWED